MNKKNSNILILGLAFFVLILNLIYFIDFKLVDKLILILIVLEVFGIFSLLSPKREIKTIEKKEQKISKLKYIGSSERQRYHKNNCKFVDLIDDSHKLESNDKEFFKKKKFKACKVCKPYND